MISTDHVIRMLGEYVEKANRARRDYEAREAIYASRMGVVASFSSGFMSAIVFVLEGASWVALVAAIAGGLFAVSFLLRVRMRSYLRDEVEIATWHLRRVYELASGHADLRVPMDSATCAELELKLSEAAFLLAELERFDKPAKFRQFNRVGCDSPFRVFPADDCPPSVTQTAEPAPPPTPPAPPDSLASPS